MDQHADPDISSPQKDKRGKPAKDGSKTKLEERAKQGGNEGRVGMGQRKLVKMMDVGKTKRKGIKKDDFPRRVRDWRQDEQRCDGRAEEKLFCEWALCAS